MIDSIKIRSTTSESNLELRKWKMVVKPETGEYYYRTRIKSIRLYFYPDSKNVIIFGRYISTYTKSKFDNFDDAFKSKKEIFEFFYNLESLLNSYFVNPVVDILNNKVTRIDYCMNLEVENVKEYLEFFNRYYSTNPKKLTPYTNHILKQKLPIHSGIYVKTSKQYEEKKNQNFTLNVYCKSDELENKKIKQISMFGKSSITDEDIIEAEKILRVEVQLHYGKLKSVCKKFGINHKTCCLYDLFNIEIASCVLKNEVKRFFTDADFYSYEKAKELIQLNVKNHKSKKAALEYIKAVAKNNKVDSTAIPKKLIEIGIFPHYFIPRDWGVHILKNPTKLIAEKIQINQLEWLKLKEGGNIYDEKI